GRGDAGCHDGSRRTVLRLTGSPSPSRSFSVQWQSLKSRYVVDQLDDSVMELAVQPSARRLAAAPVDEAPDPLDAIPGLEAPKLPWGHLQGPRSRDGDDLPGHPQLHRPGRRASLRLIVTVSQVSMGGHFYRAVRGGHFYSASRRREWPRPKRV